MSTTLLAVRTGWTVRAHRAQWVADVSLILIDTLGFLCSGALALLARQSIGAPFDTSSYLATAPLALLYPAALSMAGLYPAIGLSPAAELRGVFRGATLTCLFLAAVTFFQRDAGQYSRAALLLTWAITLLTAPPLRAGARTLLGPTRWWGVPAVLIGSGEAAMRVAEELRRRPGLGLHLVAQLGSGPELAAVAAAETGARYAILAMPVEPGARLNELLERHLYPYRHVLVMPDWSGLPSHSATACEVGGRVALSVDQSPLSGAPERLKRVFDLLVAAVAGVMALPLLALIWACVRLTSPGPALFASPRIGQGGRRFLAWKFRTMYQDGGEILRRMIPSNPALAAELAHLHKLRRDPRVTPLGRWLRRSSLDELPQLWNVIRGEMSLVGPRPILEEEVERYGPLFGLYKRARPGITGLWQVSGRNNTSYPRRLECVEHYVRNWSFWLDLVILGKTVRVVLTGEGACSGSGRTEVRRTTWRQTEGMPMLPARFPGREQHGGECCS
ncbi:MAG: undecaprenyl-phosphate galactose phosphotransferase WbaP [Acidobacteria bacterium]|nr:undecaprenyl-phosphate galactose phosphotransferase WbaP [Acidobacteriota bacterium]